ncbi:DUF5988 family protein [Micromonospora sp. CPCC 206061]|uniref:DUF5988 family protein n=1 Tax=Micromonospora sp. CPCC 206061 TaxID=3122410 RepID=UPI002FF00AC2
MTNGNLDGGLMAPARLEGGPNDFPDELRAHRGSDTDEYKIKVEHRGGYEHFERTDERDAEAVVYRWTTRTRIAE